MLKVLDDHSKQFDVDAFYDPTLGAVVLHGNTKQQVLGAAQNGLQGLLAPYAPGFSVCFGDRPCRVTLDDHRPARLTVGDYGAGLWLNWSPEGFCVKTVEERPGQDGLDSGDTIVAIEGASLQNAANEDAADWILARHMRNGAIILVSNGSAKKKVGPGEQHRHVPNVALKAKRKVGAEHQTLNRNAGGLEMRPVELPKVCTTGEGLDEGDTIVVVEGASLLTAADEDTADWSHARHMRNGATSPVRTDSAVALLPSEHLRNVPKSSPRAELKEAETFRRRERGERREPQRQQRECNWHEYRERRRHEVAEPPVGPRSIGRHEVASNATSRTKEEEATSRTGIRKVEALPGAWVWLLALATALASWVLPWAFGVS